MNITNILFRLKDTLGGSQIREHYSAIKNHFDSKKDNSSMALNNLLQHGVKNVSYYKDIDFSSLSNFSIINKSIIKSNFEDFRAINFGDKGLTKTMTSGSTGTPLTIYHDKNKKARNYGDTLYFGNKAGFELGNKLIYLKIWIKEKMQSPWIYRLQNITTVDVMNLNDIEMDALINRFKTNSNQVHNVLGYVSALEQVIRYCEKKHIDDLNCKFAGVITMSEGLSAETRLKLQKLFKCPVVSRYSNLENGIIAQQEADSDYFLVNTASYLVEIFHPDRDELLADGSLGRIVLTDLYNYVIPLIRYDTGDMGIKVKCDEKTYLKSVEGRKLDLLFNTSGEIISSYIVGRNMWQYTEIEQYQLIQVGEKSYEFKINCPQGFTKELQLVSELKSQLGKDAEFKVSYVDEIPLLSSGKRRQTVNLYRKS
jgi:phenylacetate-CoA ligase